MVKVATYVLNSVAAVRQCLLPFAEKRLFISNMSNNKVAGLQPKK